MEKISIDGRIIPTINGGHGSGNFGHLGRPGKVGGSSSKGGKAPEGFSMDSPEVVTIEEAGWRVDDLDDDKIQIGTMSDMGEDFFFYADKEKLAESIWQAAEEFDPEEHASLFLDGNGDVRQDIGGIPTDDPDDLRRDAESIKEMLWELANKVKQSR